MAAQPGIPSGHAAAFSFNGKNKTYEIENTYTSYSCNVVLKLNVCFSQAVSVLMVCFHVLELLFDESAMPRGMEVRCMTTYLYLSFQNS